MKKKKLKGRELVRRAFIRSCFKSKEIALQTRSLAEITKEDLRDIKYLNN